MPRGMLWTDEEDRALIRAARDNKDDVPKLMKAYANRVGHTRSLGGIATRLRILADEGRIAREIALFVGQYLRAPMDSGEDEDQEKTVVEAPKPSQTAQVDRKDRLEWIMRGVDLGMLDADQAATMVKKVLK